jgi:hypothetical protein
MRLKARLLGAFAVVALLVAVGGLVAEWGLRSQISGQATLKSLQTARDLVQEVKYYNADIPGWQYTYVEQSFIIGGEKAADDAGDLRKGLIADHEQLDRVLAQLPEQAFTPAESALVDELTASWQVFWASDAKVQNSTVRPGSRTTRSWRSPRSSPIRWTPDWPPPGPMSPRTPGFPGCCP